MKIGLYSCHNYEIPYLEQANDGSHSLSFFTDKLSADTIGLSKGCDGIAVFSSDDLSAPVLEQLAANGIRFIQSRSAGTDHIDIRRASELEIQVANVPEYSPYAIAEHAVALIMALNRKLIKANKRVHEWNFNLDGLTGFDLNGKTVGVIGTGKIGSVFCRIMHGFGSSILAYDVRPSEYLIQKLGVKYCSLEELFKRSDVISIHIPLNPGTRHLINDRLMESAKPGCMLINTGRGAVINTEALIRSLENGRIGSAGLDVYEFEKPLFFEDHSGEKGKDPMLKKLMGFEQVIVTGHQAFLTEEALREIAKTTINNFTCWEKGQIPDTEITQTLWQKR